MIDAMIYNPNVANNENTIFLKTEFLNTSETVNSRPSCACISAAAFSIPLNANKDAAICFSHESPPIVKSWDLKKTQTVM